MKEYLRIKAENVPCGYIICKEVENLDDNEIISEYIYLGLRMNKGVNLKEVSKYVGQDLPKIYKTWIEMCVQDGLLLNNDNIIRLTDKVQDLANYVMAGFV
jgi:oxygen-independent coproporphyrinogen-3 oxidase